MQTQQEIDFERIAQAVEYMYVHAGNQPDLETAASHVNVSPFLFQRMFQTWAGVSPKKFLQYVTPCYAKKTLRNKGLNLFDTADKVGLSGSGRLHDLFLKIEGMTPGEFKNGGKNLKINYHFSPTLFGAMLTASTGKGICFLAFSEDKNQMLNELTELFPNAVFTERNDELTEKVEHFFHDNLRNPETIKLHLKGTEFQLTVWETLLKIPEGKLTTYGAIAQQIHNPKAVRAVGSAVGNNPVSFLIPCHRVIRSTGIPGQYHWGAARKKAMIGWEAVKTSSETRND